MILICTYKHFNKDMVNIKREVTLQLTKYHITEHLILLSFPVKICKQIENRFHNIESILTLIP